MTLKFTHHEPDARPSAQSILVPLVQSGGLGSARKLLNPKPPDPEAAFAFQAHLPRPRTPRNARPIEQLPALEAKSMMRSSQALARAAAFDFDVVTDVPARPKPAPDPKLTAETAPREAGAGDLLESAGSCRAGAG
jgi:hypothetical protein